MASSEGKVCQSCGRPLNRPEDHGTNTDGSRNGEYCAFCYQKGNFTYPGMTRENMIEIYASLMVTMKDISEAEAKQMASSYIPDLKRWK